MHPTLQRERDAWLAAFGLTSRMGASVNASNDIGEYSSDKEHAGEKGVSEIQDYMLNQPLSFRRKGANGSATAILPPPDPEALQNQS